MAKTNVVCKVCKVYPAKNKRIPGILPNQKMITEPGIYHLNLKEIRRCMSYGDVFEVITGGDVLLTPENYHLDNSNAKVFPADKIPAIADTTIHYGVHKPAEDTDKKENQVTKPSGSDSGNTVSTPSDDKASATDSEQSQAATQPTANAKSVKSGTTKNNTASK